MWLFELILKGSPASSVVKNLPTMQETPILSLGWEDPLEKETAPTPVFLPGNPMDRGAWWAAGHGAEKELDTTY